MRAWVLVLLADRAAAQGLSGAAARNMASSSARHVQSTDRNGRAAYNAIVRQWNHLFGAIQRELNSKVNEATAKAAYTKSQVASYRATANNAYLARKNGPKQAKARANALFKEDDSLLRTHEKNWDSKLAEEERAFSKFVSTMNKKQSKSLKAAEKELKALGKAGETWQKVSEKGLEKESKEFNKQMKKAIATADKEREGYAQQTANQQSIGSDLTLGLETLGEEIEEQASNLMEGQGVAHALDLATRFEDGVYYRMDHTFEKSEANHISELKGVSDELQEKLVSTLEELAERSEEMDDALEDASVQANRRLQKIKDERQTAGMKLGMEFKSQKRDLKKAQRSKGRVEAALSTASDSAEKVVSKLKDEVKKGGELLSDVLTEGLHQKVALFSDALRSVHQQLNTGTEKKGNNVENSAMVNLAKLESENERHLKSAITKMERTRDAADETTVEVKASQKTTDTVTRLGDKMRKYMSGYMDMYEELEAQAAKAQMQAKQKATKAAEKLSVITSGATTHLRKGLKEAMGEMSRGQTEMQGKVSDATKAFGHSMQSLADASDHFGRTVGAGERRVQANIAEAHEAARTMRRLAKEMREATVQSQGEAEVTAEGVSEQMLQERDLLTELAKADFQKSGRDVHDLVLGGLERPIAGTVSRTRSAAQKAGASGEDTIATTEQKEVAREEHVSQRIEELADEVGNEVHRLDGIDSYWAQHDANMARARGVMGNFSVAQEEWSKRGEAFGIDTTKEVGEQMRGLDNDVEIGFEDMAGKVEGMVRRTEQAKKDALAAGSTELAQSERAIEKTQESGEGLAANVKDEVHKFQELVAADTTGKVELGRAASAVRALADEAHKGMETAAEIDQDFSKAESDVVAAVNTEMMSRDQAWAAASSAVRDNIQEIKSEDRARQTRLGQSLIDGGAQITAQEQKSEAADNKFRHEITSIEHGMENDAQRLGTETRGLENRIGDEETEELRAVEEQGAVEAQRAAQQDASAAQLGRDIASEALSASFEARDAEGAMQAVLRGMDTGAQREITQEELKQLGLLAAEEQKEGVRKTGEVGQAAQVLTERLESVTRSAEVGEEQLRKDIDDTGASVATALHEASTTLDETRANVGNVLQDGVEMANVVSRGLTQHLDGLATQFGSAADDIASAEKVGEYQSDEALQKVITVVNRAQMQTDRLLQQTRGTVGPKMEQWRNAVQAIFASLGLELDMGRVEAQYMAGVGNDTGGLVSAEQQVEVQARRARAAMLAKQGAIKRRLAEMVRQVEADKSQSEEDKRKRIAALKAMAGQSSYKLMVGTRRVLEGQGQLGKEIHEGLLRLDSLADRAAMLAQGGGGADADRLLQQLLSDLASKLDMLRHWISTGTSAPSLLEVGAEHARLDTALRGALLSDGDEPHWTPVPLLLRLLADRVGRVHALKAADAAPQAATTAGKLAAFAKEADQRYAALEREDADFDAVAANLPKLLPLQS